MLKRPRPRAIMIGPEKMNEISGRSDPRQVDHVGWDRLYMRQKSTIETGFHQEPDL